MEGHTQLQTGNVYRRGRGRKTTAALSHKHCDESLVSHLVSSVSAKETLWWMVCVCQRLLGD